MPVTNIFIQARMSSSRFPGKMLVPVAGVPLLDRVMEQARRVGSAQTAVISTSREKSDDPLAAHCQEKGYNCFRGSLHNVFLRFQETLEAYPCDFLARVSGDSPLISPELIDFFIKKMLIGNYDFFSNVRERTFPNGQSLEIVKSEIMKTIDATSLSPNEQEHVTPCFYRGSYKTLFATNTLSQGDINLCIDTPDDLKRLEQSFKPYYFEPEKVCLSEN